MNTQLVLGLAILVGAPAGKPAPKAAPEPTLVGEWAFDSWVEDGTAVDCAGRTIRFDPDGKYLCRQGDQHQGSGTYKLDKGKDTGDMDWTEDGLPNPIQGIFKFEDGGDTIVVCVMDAGKKGRPSAFAAPAGSDCSLFTLKRVKKKD